MTPSLPLRLEVVGRTSTGRVRRNNEDMLWVGRVGDPAARSGDGAWTGACEFPGVLLAVADGMGGAKAGEVASRMAVETLAAEVARSVAENSGGTDPVVLGDRAVQAAHVRIREDARGNPRHEGMGTTLTAAWVHGCRADLFQVGDSRAYLWRGGGLAQLTRDQTLVARLLEEGLVSAEEAERLPISHVITQALGSEEDLSVVHGTTEVVPGDLLLLCTDGLSGLLRPADLETTLAAGGPVEQVVARLVSQAEDRGGTDNITVVVARFGP